MDQSRVRLPLLLVVSWTEKIHTVFPCLSPFAPESLASRDAFGRPRSRVSLLILQTWAEYGGVKFQPFWSQDRKTSSRKGKTYTNPRILLRVLYYTVDARYIHYVLVYCCNTKCHEEVLYWQPMILPKCFDIFPLTGEFSEGLGAFCCFFGCQPRKLLYTVAIPSFIEHSSTIQYSALVTI